jgi:hypothetical protein
MAEDNAARKGPIEGTSRVLRELIRTPRFKQSVGIILRELDPENARLLVRTLLWEDPEFALSLLGATPELLNALIASGDELMIQAAGFPPGVLTGFIAGVIERLDARSLGHAAGRAIALSATLSGQKDEAIAAAASGFREGIGAGLADSLAADQAADGAAGLALEVLVPMLSSVVSRLGSESVREGSETQRLVRGIIESIRQVASENPEFMTGVIEPLLEAGREVLADSGPAGAGA